MTESTININTAHGLPIVSDRTPDRTITALIEGAELLGTTRGVEYMRVGVVLARNASDGTVVGIYATEQQWPETSAAALIERETDNTRLRAALAAQEARFAEQGTELAQLRAQLADPAAHRRTAPAVSLPAASETRTPIPCPVPGCPETRLSGQALGRHCQTEHGAILSVLRVQYAAPSELGGTTTELTSPTPAPQSAADVGALAPLEGAEACPFPDCAVQLPAKPLAHHAIDVHGELLSVLRLRYSTSAAAVPASTGAT